MDISRSRPKQGGTGRIAGLQIIDRRVEELKPDPKMVRGDLDGKAYCLTGECSPDFECCLTARAPVASLIWARATAPLPNLKSMLTDVGPVELWATRQRRPSAAANPQGSLRRDRWNSRSRHC
jgi:hypothetical protein